MLELFRIDLGSMFIPSGSLGDMVVRGTLVYLFLFFLLRILRREAGALNIADLLLIVLVADAAQNAMANEYKSITEGAVLIATIAAWDYSFDWLAYRFPRFDRLVSPPPLPLIKDGRIIKQNLRKELISREELMSQLRQQGIEDPSQVKRMYLEGDGQFSVVPSAARKPEEKKQKAVVK